MQHGFFDNDAREYVIFRPDWDKCIERTLQIIYETAGK